MNASNIGKALLAGLAATVVMTMLTMMATVMGLPMNIPGMLSGFMGVPILVGWTVHFMIGLAFAVIYAFVFIDKLKGSPAMRGALFGLIPFLMAQIVVMPMMGMGFFTSSAPNAIMLVMGSLMGHIAFGAVVGGVYGIPLDNQTQTQAV